MVYSVCFANRVALTTMTSPLKPRSQYYHQAGFSLVELAIVLLIIGLIIGGILKGQELLESARLKSILTQVNDYRVQTSIFLEKYGYLPGDFNKAKGYIDDSLTDGDGDGMIKGEGLNGQTLSFWAHLAAAKLIPEPGKPTENKGSFGKGAPATRMGGGITISYGDFESSKHWFVVGKKDGLTGKGALLTPLQAYSLTNKVDGGYIRAADGSDVTTGACITSGEYNMKTTIPACILYFMM